MASPSISPFVILDRAVERHQELLDKHESAITDLRVTVSALSAKVAIYAALGATVGAAVVSAVITLFV